MATMLRCRVQNRVLLMVRNCPTLGRMVVVARRLPAAWRMRRAAPRHLKRRRAARRRRIRGPAPATVWWRRSPAVTLRCRGMSRDPWGLRRICRGR